MPTAFATTTRACTSVSSATAFWWIWFFAYLLIADRRR